MNWEGCLEKRAGARPGGVLDRGPEYLGPVLKDGVKGQVGSWPVGGVL